MFTDDYDLLEKIDYGRYGVVSKVKCRETGKTFAVKIIDKSPFSGDTTDKGPLINEPKALHRLSDSYSPASLHITRLHAVYDTPTHLHLILDFIPYPSLFDFLNLHQHVPEHVARPIMFSLLRATLHCHLSGAAHRDIKPENILFDSETGKLKLCDFGACGLIHEEEMSELVGTPYYMAPEVIEAKEYDEKVDVWSLGVVLYTMLSGFWPFYGTDVDEIYQNVLKAKLTFPSSSVEFSSSVKDLLRRMICKDVYRRFSVQQALRHPWFTEDDGLSAMMTS